MTTQPEILDLEIPGNGSGPAINSATPRKGAPGRKSSARKSGGGDRKSSDTQKCAVTTQSFRESGAGSQQSGDTQTISAAGTHPRKGRGSGQSSADTQPTCAGAAKKPRSRKAKGEEVGEGQRRRDTQTTCADPDLRFVDPLIVSIVLQHRQRVRWMRARNGLILQGKAFCRSHYDGDKKAGEAAFDRIVAGKQYEDESGLAIALIPFISAMRDFDEHLKRIEKDLEKLAKRLPVAAWVDAVPGFGFGSLASIVGECGDIGAYRTVSGVWRRLGLAPFKKGDVTHAGMTWRIDKWRDGPGLTKEEWVEFGYSGRRRSVAWNAAEPIARRQRAWVDKETGEIKKPADPYGEFLNAEKARALAKGWTPGHAEAHARRVMFKRILRDLWIAWREVAGHQDRDTHHEVARNLTNSVDPSRSVSGARSNCAGIEAEAA